MNRRTFLGSVAAGAVALSSHQALAADDPAAKIKIGLIGCGGYGLANVRAALKTGGAQIVAVCDVDSAQIDKIVAEIEKLQGSKPQTFKLYNDLLKVTGLQAVIIATPPQWHALQFIASLEAGMDVYCEKPLAYDIREGRAMVEAAKKHAQRIVQIGFQRRKADGFRQAREYVLSGAPGRIVQVDAQIHYNSGTLDPTPQDPPATLDWDLWCGPAPKIPYSPQVGHRNWRQEKTTGHGHLVDWGIHLMDQVRWFLGESVPRSVVAAGGTYVQAGKITTPDTLTVCWEFEKCPVTWRHRMWGAEEFTPETNNGIFFFGDKETVFVTDSKWVVIPKGKNKDRKVNETKNDAGGEQMAEFLSCVRSRKQPGQSVEDALHSLATVKLAMIAYDTGRRIAFDGAKEAIVGDPEAAKLLTREYRGPWVHPWQG